MNFLKTVIYRAGAAVGTLLFTVIVATYPNKDIITRTFSLVILLYALSIVSRLGMEMFLVKKYSKDKWFYPYIDTAILLTILVSLLLSLGSFSLLESESAIFILMLLPAFSVLSILSYLKRAQGELFKSSLFEPGTGFFIASITLIICNHFFSELNSPLKVITVVFNLVLFFGLYELYTERTSGFTNISSLSRLTKISSVLIKRSWSFMLIALAAYLLMWAPAFYIQKKSAVDFIDYNVAMRFLAPLTFLITTVDFFLSRRVALNYKFSNFGKIKEDIKSFRILFLIVSFFGYALVGLSLIYLSDFIQVSQLSIYLFLIVAMGYCISSVIGPCGIVLNMTGNEKVVSKITVASTCVVILFLWISEIFLDYNVIFVSSLLSFSILTRNLIMFIYLRNKF